MKLENIHEFIYFPTVNNSVFYRDYTSIRAFILWRECISLYVCILLVWYTYILACLYLYIWSENCSPTHLRHWAWTPYLLVFLLSSFLKWAAWLAKRLLAVRQETDGKFQGCRHLTVLGEKRALAVEDYGSDAGGNERTNELAYSVLCVVVFFRSFAVVIVIRYS